MLLNNLFPWLCPFVLLCVVCSHWSMYLLTKDHQNLIRLYRVAFFDFYFLDRSLIWRIYKKFHFNGVHDYDFILSIDLIIQMNNDTDDFSGHGGFYFYTYFCKSPYPILYTYLTEG